MTCLDSEKFIVNTEEGKWRLSASVRIIGSDLLVAIWGGEKPHIGAVAIAQPRASLENSYQTSASASVYCLVGHKEDELSRMVSLKIASVLNLLVVVTVGIHWDNINEEGISAVVANCRNLAEKIIEEFLLRPMLCSHNSRK